MSRLTFSANAAAEQIQSEVNGKEEQAKDNANDKSLPDHPNHVLNYAELRIILVTISIELRLVIIE